MDTTSLKQLLDACFLAKRIVETLPQLPEHMKPRHIHVLDAVSELQTGSGGCRVSDVSGRLGITLPSVTKLVQELEKLALLEKYQDEADRRVTLLKLTPRGQECVREHVMEFHGNWARSLDDVGEKEVQEAVRVIGRLWETLPKEG